jgi:PqqD family protein of HPr-rel-A system
LLHVGEPDGQQLIVGLPRSERSPPERFVVTQGLRIWEFDDEAVVFDPISWDAHLLNPAATAVLELLQQTPRTEAEIAAFLADALEFRVKAQAAVHTKRLLGDLQALGLVRAGKASEDANL